MRALFVKVHGARNSTKQLMALRRAQNSEQRSRSNDFAAHPEQEEKMSKVIATPKAPAAVGPYSQAIQVSEVSDIIFISGQLGLIPETGDFPEGGVEAQARQSLENIKAILSEAGFTMANVVKTTVLLSDIADFAKVNAIYAEFFADGALPARSAFQVAALPKGGLVEIEAICAR